MSSQLKQQPDSSLRVHLDTLHNNHQLNNKVGYAFACIANALSPTNYSRRANIEYLKRHKDTFLQFITQASSCSQEQLLNILILINAISTQDKLAQNQQQSVLKLMSNANISGEGISEQLCDEIKSFCFRSNLNRKKGQLIIDSIIGRLNPSQLVQFLNSFNKNQFYFISITELIRLARQYRNQVDVLITVLQIMQWRIANFLASKSENDEEVKQASLFLAETAIYHISNNAILSLCGLAYSQLTYTKKKLLVSKNTDAFLRQSVESYTPKPYLPSKDCFLQNCNQLVEIIATEASIKQGDFKFLLSYFSVNPFQSRKQLQSLQTKNVLFKELLLRATQPFQTTNSSNRIGIITQQKEIQIVEWIPMSCIRSVGGLLRKISIGGAFEAFRALNILQKFNKAHPKYQELLVKIVETSVQNREFKSLEQISKIVQNDVSAETVINKIKEKASIKNVDSNKESKRYFIFVPLLLNKQQIQSLITKQLQEIFGYETVSLDLKFYVADFLLRKMVLSPLKRFAAFLTRTVEEGRNNSAFKLLDSYLRGLENLSPATIDWAATHFSAEGLRLLELLFSKLIGSRGKAVCSILFQLQKLGVYGSGKDWAIIYRWALQPLQETFDQTRTLDQLQLVQMLFQKMASIPDFISERFTKIVKNNWGKYSHEHYFVLEGIMDLLSQQPKKSFGKKILAEVPQITVQHQAFQKRVGENLSSQTSPLVDFLTNLSWNLFFEHIDKSSAIRIILSLIKDNDLDVNKNVEIRVSVLKVLLHMVLYIYENGQETAPKEIDLIVFNTIIAENPASIELKFLKGLCLQYLSRVPHSVNILKLPLNSLLNQGFNQPGWFAAITELLDIVIESKPKAIGTFKLQQIIKWVLMRLISLQGGALQQLIDFIDVTCFTEGDYQIFLGQNLQLVQRILKAEMQGSGYRPNLVLIMLQILQNYDQELDPNLQLLLLAKYSNQSKIVKLLLQYLQKQGISKESIDQQLLMRLVLLHTQDAAIQEKCKTIFHNNIPPANTEKQFVSLFADAKYENCQQIIAKVTNPFALNIEQAEIRAFLEWKQAATKSKKLLSLLYEIPDSNFKIHSCDAFYLNKDYIVYLNRTLQDITKDFALGKFMVTKQNGYFSLRENKLQKIVFQRLSEILRNKGSSLQLKSLIIEVSKNNHDLFSMIIDFIVNVLGKFKKYGEYSRSSIEVYYAFCRDIISTCTINPQPLISNFKQLVYMFPLVCSDLHDNQTTITQILRHYFALVQNFKIIEKDIGILKYIVKVQEEILKRFMAQEENAGFQIYQRMCTQLEGFNEINLAQIKVESFQTSHKSFVTQILTLVNQFVRGKMTDASTKLSLNFVTDYISAVMYSFSNGLLLDPQTHQNLKKIQENLSSYNFSQQNLQILKEALAWVLKKATAVKNHNQDKTFQKKSLQQNVEKTKDYESVKGEYATKKQNETKNLEKQEKSQVYQQDQDQYGQLALYKSLLPSKAQQADESQITKETQQAYIRFKQTEQYITIHQQQVVTNKTVIIINEDSPVKKQVQPVEKQFDEKNFFEQSKKTCPSEKQRKENLEIAQKIQNQEFSMQSLKDHCKFVGFLAELNSISQIQFEQLLISSTSITETVLSHAYYVKKVLDAETIVKLIRIYKVLHTTGKQPQASAVVLKILSLCVAMTEKKQKKMQIFGDQQTTNFFKLVVKRALNGQKNREQIQLLIQILYSCRINTQSYFKEGLFSMTVELINRNICTDLVIDYLNRIDLTSQYINEIYQRDLFNKLMIAVAKEPNNPQERALLNLWIKLAGKVCINHSIQQKFRNKQLHIKVWERFQKTVVLPEQLNLCFFFSYLCIKHQGICQWLIKNKVLEDLLNGLKGYDQTDQLYLLFYHFCFNNEVGRDYCFRIKYHLHLIDRLNSQFAQVQKNSLTKYFFKSLGQMMSSKLYVSTFFKEETVKKLIEIYNAKTEPAIFECLLDFVSILESDSQFDELKKQNFWSSLKQIIFEYKMNSEATYSYLLQIFLVMIKKGRTKEFNHPEVRSKVCLKAQYSINMDGKELALRFIVALCIKNKENYLTQRCIRLLASIMGFKVSQSQLQLNLQMLKIQGVGKNNEFLAYFSTHNIISLIVESFQTFTQEATALALEILTILSYNSTNSKSICLKMLDIIEKAIKSDTNIKGYVQLLVSLSSTKQNDLPIQNSQISNYITSSQFLANVKKSNAQKQYNLLLATLSKNQVIKQQQLKAVSKIASQQLVKVNIDKVQSQNGQNSHVAENAYLQLRQGRKVKMYKTDGSISQLIIYISSDRLELNCAVKPSEVVKAKWRLPVNQIKKIITYKSQDNQEFLDSVFEKNSGFFSKTPSHECCLSLLGKNNQFHICFESKIQKQLWMSDLSIMMENAKQLLSKLK